MFIDRPALKRQARELINTTKPSPVLVALVFVLVSALVSYLYGKVSNVMLSPAEYQEFLRYYTAGDAQSALEIVANHEPTAAGGLVGVLLRIVSLMLSAGFTIFSLNVIRRTAPCFGNLLDGFGMFLRIIVLSVLEGLFVFLWSLLLVVPGIIASYRYRLALYLLLDHPEMSPMQCIRESKRLMNGYKGALFVMDLSFIGWSILAALPIVGYFVMLWVTPYQSLSYALFYTTLTGTNCLGASAYDNGEQNDYNDNQPWQN